MLVRAAPGARRGEHARGRREFTERARGGPDPARGLLASLGRGARLGVALDDPVGDGRQHQQLLAAGCALEPGLRRGDAVARPSRPLGGAGGGDPLADLLGGRAVERPQVESRRARDRADARISGSVTVPSSRSVPRALPVRSGGPWTSRTSSRSWKASPMAAEGAERALLALGAPRGRTQAHSNRLRSSVRSVAGSAR